MAQSWLRGFVRYVTRRAAWEGLWQAWSSIPEPWRKLVMGPVVWLVVGSGFAAVFRTYWWAFLIGGLWFGFGMAGVRIAVRDWKLEHGLPQRSDLLRMRADGRSLRKVLDEEPTWLDERKLTYASELVAAWRSKLDKFLIDNRPDLSIKLRQKWNDEIGSRAGRIQAEKAFNIGAAKMIASMDVALDWLDEIIN